MTGDDGTPGNPENSYYIPPTAEPVAKELKNPEKSSEDLSGLAIIVLGTIILIAGFQLFLIIMQLINTWISDQLVPIFSGVFDIVIILGGIWLIQNYLRKK